MLELEHIVYLSRKLHWSKEEIGKLHPQQAVALYNEVVFQESVDEWGRQFEAANILAAIYNTIPTKSQRVYKPQDFLSSDKPIRGGERSQKVDKLEKSAEEAGIKLPSK